LSLTGIVGVQGPDWELDAKVGELGKKIVKRVVEYLGARNINKIYIHPYILTIFLNQIDMATNDITYHIARFIAESLGQKCEIDSEPLP